MNDYGFFDNSDNDDYFNSNPNLISLNESNYESHFFEDFCCNIDKFELHPKNIDLDFIDNKSTKEITNNANAIINETKIEIIPNFNCKKRRRNSSPSDSNNMKINYTNNNSSNINADNGVNNSNFPIISNVISKKKGRKPKNKINNNNVANTENLNNKTNSNEHNKFSEDNKIRKFKTHFYQIFLITISNEIIKKYYKKETEKFKKSAQEVITKLNIKENLELLNSPLKDFLKKNTGVKFDENHNKNLMEKYINKNKYIEFLFETKIDALYKILINDNCKNILKSLFTIDCDLSLDTLIESINDDDQYYKNELKKTWKNIYSFFDKSKIRNKKK